MRPNYALSVRPVLMGLALLLACQSIALAVEFTPPADADLPDALNGPSADRVPPGLACTDNMDFAPEAGMPSPFDADRVAFRQHQAAPTAPLSLRAAASERCIGRVRIDLA